MKHAVTELCATAILLSVLSVEPYGMKLELLPDLVVVVVAFSALGRAVWDETADYLAHLHQDQGLSVLSVEPYGMKPKNRSPGVSGRCAFSALGRAVWDETMNAQLEFGDTIAFQCSRSSRMG